MERKEEVAVSGMISLEMFKQYNVYHSKKLLRVVTLIVSIGYPLILLALDVVNVFVATLTGLVMWGILTALLPSAIKRRAAKEYKSDQMIKNELFITVNNEGIHQKVKRSVVYWDWNDINSIKEHKEMFLFYVSKNKAVILPQKFLFNDDQSRLRRIIQQNAVSQKVKLLEESI
ncbi:YcxB family protein [Sutcliffiella deserti]|uniref:YcxB family protein n=1 Tax=Sutcliffiella deserti TaxID=2875501 RepID=UPI001CBE7A81|nr:YcxB family protein [Sutcliffiella deserti]